MPGPWSVILTPDELKRMRAVIKRIGVRAAAKHFCVGRLPMRAIASGKKSVYPPTANAIRSRLDVVPPTAEELRAGVLDRMRTSSRRRWSKLEERERARQNAIAQHEPLRRKREALEAAREERLRLIRERAASVLGSAHGTTPSARSAPAPIP